MSERAVKAAKKETRRFLEHQREYFHLRPCPWWCPRPAWRWALRCAIRFVYLGDG